MEMNINSAISVLHQAATEGKKSDIFDFKDLATIYEAIKFTTEFLQTFEFMNKYSNKLFKQVVNSEGKTTHEEIVIKLNENEVFLITEPCFLIFNNSILSLKEGDEIKTHLINNYPILLPNIK